MRDGWKRVKLGEIAEVLLGKMLDQKKNRGELHPFLNNVSVRWGGFDLSDLGKMRFESDELERYQIRKGDIVVCEGGESGRCAMWKNEQTILYQKALHRVRVNEGVDQTFVYYQLYDTFVNGKADALITGSTIKHLPRQAMLQVDLLIPPLATQRRIAAVLGALDDKIELNRKMNANLEAQAQALFKSWFVDFEPWGGKMPSGWRNGTLGDVARLGRDQFNPLRHAGLLVDHFSLPAFDDCRFPVRESADVIKSNKFRLTKRSILVSKLNPTIKRVWYPEITSEWSVGSTEFLVFEPKVEDARPWLYSVLNSSEYSAHLIEHATGSTNSHQRVSQDDALAYELTLPPDDIVSSFSRKVGRLFDLILKNINESRKLAELRDALLPKLMSGELEVA